MSTVVANHRGESQSNDSSSPLERDSEILSPESDHAMARARQRASMYVCQTAPQSVASSAATSPAAKQPGSLLWKKDGYSRVKSSLKLRPGLQRSNSEPSQKTVHFSTTNLVNVRQFNGTQRPSAVGRTHRMYGSVSQEHSGSPKMFDEDSLSLGDTDNEDEDEVEDEDEDEDDYSSDSGNFPDNGSAPHFWNRLNSSTARMYKNHSRNSQEWTLLTPGFLPHAFSRLHGPQRPSCYVETLQLSSSSPSLNAIVYVRNLTFHKYVALRYTINEWATFSETQGIYSSDIRKFDRDAGFDRFDVSIPLSAFSSSSLNNSVLKFCVHFVADGTEFWDNNGGKNYEVYLRNLKLASASPLGYIDHALQPRTENPLDPRRKRNLEPQVSLSDEEGSDGKRANALSSTDFLRRAGIPMRTTQEVKLRDPFCNRYSFEAAFSSSPKSPREYSSAPIYAIEGDQIVAESRTHERSQPLKVSRSQDYESSASVDSRRVSPLSGGPASVLTLSQSGTYDSGAQTADPHAWESDTYKDFVSKYCFYTPSNRATNSAKQGEAPSEPIKASKTPAKTDVHPQADHIERAIIPRTTI